MERKVVVLHGLREIVGSRSVPEFARAVGVTENSVRKYMKGANCEYPIAVKIAEVLGVLLSSLCSPFSLPPIPMRGLSGTVRELIGNAYKAEKLGDPWKAAELYSDSLKSLLTQPEHSVHAVLKARQRLNEGWARALRPNLDPTLIRIVDEEDNVVDACVKSKAHDYSNPRLHHTVILMLTMPDGKILCERRHKDQSFENRLDFLGGHALVNDFTPLQTALREANEEVRLELGARRVAVREEWLQQVGAAYQFTHDGPLPDNKGWNRERSTLFLVTIPPHPALRIRIEDEAQTGPHIVQMGFELHTLKELVDEFVKNPDAFADGAGRVLKECVDSQKLKRLFGPFGLA